VQILGKKNKFL